MIPGDFQCGSFFSHFGLNLFTKMTKNESSQIDPESLGDVPVARGHQKTSFWIELSFWRPPKNNINHHFEKPERITKLTQ